MNKYNFKLIFLAFLYYLFFIITIPHLKSKNFVSLFKEINLETGITPIFFQPSTFIDITKPIYKYNLETGVRLELCGFFDCVEYPCTSIFEYNKNDKVSLGYYESSLKISSIKQSILGLSYNIFGGFGFSYIGLSNIFQPESDEFRKATLNYMEEKNNPKLSVYKNFSKFYPVIYIGISKEIFKHIKFYTEFKSYGNQSLIKEAKINIPKIKIGLSYNR